MAFLSSILRKMPDFESTDKKTYSGKILMKLGYKVKFNKRNIEFPPPCCLKEMGGGGGAHPRPTPASSWI